MINLFIANTDNRWFDFLSAEREICWRSTFGNQEKLASKRFARANFSSFA